MLGKKGNITISKEHGEALEASIATWERRVRGEGIPEGHGNCALCVLHGSGALNNNIYSCSKCVVGIHTGQTGCDGTPYETRYKNPNYRSDEVDFLKSLRVYKEDAIVVGSRVTVKDYSRADRITPGGIVTYDMSSPLSGVVHTVIATGVQLPVPCDNHSFGDPENRRNDTILRNKVSGDIIFTTRKFLEIAEQPCDKCGK